MIYQDQEFQEFPEISPEDVFEQCRFIGVPNLGGSLSSVHFLDCYFQQCDFSNCTVLNSEWRGCILDACKLIGIDWSLVKKVLGFEIHCKESILDLCNFSFMDISQCSFHECRFEETSFNNLKASHVVFTDSQFTNASFLQVDFTGADFRGCKDYLIDHSSNILKKAKFSLPEALELLKPLGITIEGLD